MQKRILMTVFMITVITAGVVAQSSLPPNDTFYDQLQPLGIMSKEGCAFRDTGLAIVDSLDAGRVLTHGQRRQFSSTNSTVSTRLDVSEPASRVCPLKSKRTCWRETTLTLTLSKLTFFYDHFSRFDNCSFTAFKRHTSSGCTTSNYVAGEPSNQQCQGAASCGTGFVMVARDCSCQPTGSPIILIMVHGARFDISSAQEGRPFDLDGDGRKEQMAFPVDVQNVGFLYLDSQGVSAEDGTPLMEHNGRNLFGNFSSQKRAPGVQANGFLALAQWDDLVVQNGRIVGRPDGKITASDGVWPLLKVWFDLNRDGLADRDQELKTLAELGIVKLDLEYKENNRQDGSRLGNRIPLMANFWKEGDNSPYFMVDYWAATIPLN